MVEISSQQRWQHLFTDSGIDLWEDELVLLLNAVQAEVVDEAHDVGKHDASNLVGLVFQER